MVALIIQTEEELEKLKRRDDFDEDENMSMPLPGIYYKHLGEWCARDLRDLNMMDQFGYILARPISV